MNIQYCSIDPAINNVGIAIIQIEGDKFNIISKATLRSNPKSGKWQKKLDMLELFKYFLRDKIDNVSFFVFENYSYGSPGQLADLGEMIGMFKKHISDAGKSFDTIAPNTVKLRVAGHGHASKEKVQEGLHHYLVDPNVTWNSLDESDAVAIGIAYAKVMQEKISELE